MNIMRIPLYLILFVGLPVLPLQAQVNVLGKPGAVFTPSAEWDTLNRMHVSFAQVPREFGINGFMFKMGYTEHHYGVSLPLTDFARLNVNLTRLPELANRIGVGDRHLDLSLRLLRERPNRPALLLVLTPNFGGSNFLSQDLLVASKSFALGKLGRLGGSLGYASPFFLGRPADPLRFNLPDTWSLHRKSAAEIHYLNGFFGSIRWQPREFISLLMEHDTQRINLGIALRWREHLSVQGNLLDGRVPSVSVGARLSLYAAPFEARKQGNSRKR